MKEFIQSNKWHQWHIRHRSPLFTYFIFYSCSFYTHPSFPYSIRSGGIALDHVITKEDELEKFRQRLWEYFHNNSRGILTIMQDMYQKNERDRAFLRPYLSTEWSKVSETGLLQAYQDYIALVAGYGPSIFIPLAVESLLSETSMTYVQKQFGNEWSRYENSVMTPLRDSNAIDSRRSLLNIACRIQEHAPAFDVQSAWEKHSEQFAFMKNKGFFFEFYTQSEFDQELAGLENPRGELPRLDKEMHSRKELWQALMEQIPDEFGRELLLTTNEAVFFRTWRTEAIIQTSWYARSLFQEIARRIGLKDGRDVLYLYPPEVAEALNQKKDFTEKVARRKEGYIFLTDTESNIMTLEGKEATDLGGILHFTTEVSGELRGTPAYRGKVRGKVLVVTDRADFPKIMGAEILVTHCTFPEMVPYMARVKAIVTEEGGILSHAALISREFKIPSVIGTKVATEVLQTGDMVEVDAEQGIVRKM